MVAYSFKPRFIAPILSGAKTQTIRAPRKRHARPGEALQLYAGMRTKRCELIRRATCLAVHDIALCVDPASPMVIIPPSADLLVMEHRDGVGAVEARFNGRDPMHRSAFARLDGFEDWRDMAAFWKVEHDADKFEGVLIRWAP